MEKLRSIQALRAFAAVTVLSLHASLEVTYRGWSHGLSTAFQGWGNCGVDVFFVISGVIMMMTTAGRRSGMESAATFFRARVTRIVPLYWGLTTVMVMLLLFLPHSFPQNKLDIPHAVGSYLFIPIENRFTKYWRPVLGPGWTLICEIWFYAIFAVLLMLPRKLTLPTIIGFFGLTTGLGLFVEGGAAFRLYTNPVMLEFVFGCVIGAAFQKGASVPQYVAHIMFWGGVAALLATQPIHIGPAERFFYWGAPAAFIVAGAMFLERRGSWPSNSIVTNIGDASYSLYLSHVLVLYALVVVARKIDAARAVPGDVVFAIFACACLIVGWVTYRAVERPIDRWMRHRVPAQRLANRAQIY